MVLLHVQAFIMNELFFRKCSINHVNICLFSSTTWNPSLKNKWHQHRLFLRTKNELKVLYLNAN
jgi:hypothetical protein